MDFVLLPVKNVSFPTGNAFLNTLAAIGSFASFPRIRLQRLAFQ